MKITRRDFLITTAGSAGLLPFASAWGLKFDPTSPFQHGIASGDPLATSVVLWTRITPRHPRKLVKVKWLVATDPDMSHLVDAGLTIAGAARDFTVKVLARRLNPATTYYRPVYRTRQQRALRNPWPYAPSRT